jgi:hypothetical protein
VPDRLIIARAMCKRMSQGGRLSGVLVAGGLHIDLGAEAELGSPAGIVEFENDALALTHHAKDRARQRVASKLVIIEVGVAHDKTVPGCGVVSLDDALHEMNRRLGFSRP